MRIGLNSASMAATLLMPVMASAGLAFAAMAQHPACQKVVLTGEVRAGAEWSQAIGQGWILRLLPIDAAKTPPGQAAYSGWDLVVDRERPAGFPDALLLATPPFDSINEREIGTTFGVRAQDAIGWNPRSFRFLTDPADLREAQELYRNMGRERQARTRLQSPSAAPGMGTSVTEASQRLIELSRLSSAGLFRILDARLAPGIADAAPFAQDWAIQFARTPHSFAPASGARATPLGELLWMRFSITLWLPERWRAPALPRPTQTPCFE